MTSDTSETGPKTLKNSFNPPTPVLTPLSFLCYNANGILSVLSVDNFFSETTAKSLAGCFTDHGFDAAVFFVDIHLSHVLLYLAGTR